MLANDTQGVASRHYEMVALESRIAQMGPHALIGLLYTRLIASLDALIAASNDGDTVAGEAHAAQARTILHVLEDSLDFDRCDELAPTLQRAFSDARLELGRPPVAYSPAKLSEYRDLFSGVAYAWATLGN